MKEIQHILAAYDRLDFSKQQAALATVVRVEGSSYRRVGARMLVVDDGHWTGGISGGCLEGDALKRANQAIHLGKPSYVTYDTREDDPYQIGVGLGCNGLIEVLFAPLRPDDPQNAVEALRFFAGQRAPGLLLTVIRTDGHAGLLAGQAIPWGSKQARSAFSEMPPGLQTDARTAMETRRSVMQTYQTPEGSLEILLEFLPPALHLILLGGNYDVFPLARMGKEMGWKVSVVTRLLKAPKAFFEIADEVLDLETAPETDPYTALVLMSHDYARDRDYLIRMIPAPIPYIGMLGPRKRSERIFAELTSANISIPYDRIFAPIGLDIGALTPEEIALAIAAEIQSFFAGHRGGYLREKEGPIHKP